MQRSGLEEISNGLSQLYRSIGQFKSFLNRPEVKAQLRTFFDEIAKIPEDTKRFLADLAYRGWFLTDAMTLNELSVFYALATAQNSVDETQIDDVMEAMIERYINHIKSRLFERFPGRRSVLEAAFGAHERGEYDLAMPVFLAQADGIGAELLNGVSPFSRRSASGGMLATGAAINALSSRVDTILIESLGLPLGMTANTASAERRQHAHIYNRHEILHGVSLDYGNKTNSLKAISLLGHLATMLYDVVEEYRAAEATQK